MKSKNRMSLDDYRTAINQLYGGGDTSPIRKNNTKTKARKQTIQKVHRLQKNSSVKLHEGPFEIEVKIHGKCRADIDNVLKGVLDSLNGLAYKDDRQCVKASVELCGS